MFILNTIVNRLGEGIKPYNQYKQVRDEVGKTTRLTTEEFLGVVEVSDTEKLFIDEIVTRGDGIEVTTKGVANYRGLPATSPEEVQAYRLSFTRDDGDVGSIILQTKDRDIVKELHLEFAAICQQEGVDAAQDSLLDNPIATWGG